MRARRRKGSSRGLALVAAFMLVLHSVVPAFAGQAPDILPFKRVRQSALHYGRKPF
ncbi:hypothetical protein U8C32_24120 (plasmid) [Sinorhizobium medicae]|uniref:hypothetical protein n=1 Tax=Sinorhizobium medicae TaxID=110321 RepID=UPI00299F0C2E|nr:hypothetical protein [Sinorhizobium medicae]WQO47552.1 hypothetical protein U8C42_24315 [Sinorhizobium medicae]WQO68563.1 hypothetical protein U8C40_24100 [Sinorhizobium medicae]WQO75616.1 hypothetical protein U8C31_23845 [Sinorhizobium medicae]WQO94166.1 hypothetical protein U8C32_24120 [Sinorhizobium medicae]